MSTLAQQLGHITKVSINGQEWMLTRSTWDMQAAWGAWLAERAEKIAMKIAAGYRRQAEPLWAELAELRRRADSPTPLSDAERGELNSRGAEITRQANALEQAARDTVERFQDRYAAGEFEYHSATVGQMAQTNLPGQFFLVWLCLQPKHPGITLQDVIKAHMPNGGPENFIGEWREALLRSEGVLPKKETGDPSQSGSTNSTETTTSASTSSPASP